MKHLIPWRGFWGSWWNTLAGFSVCLIIVFSGIVNRWEERPPAYQRAAEHAINREDYTEARAILEPRIAEDPENDYLLRLYGMVLLNLGDRDEGHEYYRRSLVLNPHQPGLFRYLKRVGELPQGYVRPGGPGS